MGAGKPRCFSLGAFLLMAAAVLFYATPTAAADPATRLGQDASASPAVDQYLRRAARDYLGMPYRYGSTGGKGIDCSALVQKVYGRVFGVRLPRNSAMQSKADILVPVNRQKQDLAPGDLLFFRRRGRSIGHVGIYLSDNQFLHASRTLGVTISEFNPYWKKRLVTTKRLVHQAFLLELNAATRLDDDEGQFVELGCDYARSRQLRLRAGMFSRFSQPADNPGDLLVPSGIERYLQTYGKDPAQFESGVHLSAQLSPFDWLDISPSYRVARNMGDNGSDDPAIDQTLQLGMQLTPAGARWAIGISAQGTRHSQSFEWLQKTEADFMEYAVSFGMAYSVTDLLTVSITGTHNQSIGTDSETEDNPQAELPNRDVSFQIDLSF